MWTKTIAWCGKVETVECKEHSYAWSGKMPCTGIRRCVYCGKPADDTMVDNVTSTFDYGNIRIRQSYSPLGKHVEVMLNHGDHWEIISAADPRAQDAFIALHNSKVVSNG